VQGRRKEPKRRLREEYLVRFCGVGAKPKWEAAVLVWRHSRSGAAGAVAAAAAGAGAGVAAEAAMGAAAGLESGVAVGAAAGSGRVKRERGQAQPRDAAAFVREAEEAVGKRRSTRQIFK
jgi:hypothetical protein